MVDGLRATLKRVPRKRRIDFIELDQDVEYSDIMCTDFEHMKYQEKRCRKKRNLEVYHRYLVIGTYKILEEEQSPLKINPRKEPDDNQNQIFDKYEKESQRFYLKIMDFQKPDRVSRKRQLGVAMNHMIAEILSVCQKGKEINFDTLFRWFNEKLGDFQILFENEKSYNQVDSRGRD